MSKIDDSVDMGFVRAYNRYLRPAMNHQNLTTFIDSALTPQNAETKGYAYIDDVIYDKVAPDEMIMDISEFCHKSGCKLGKPTRTIGNASILRALYAQKGKYTKASHRHFALHSSSSMTTLLTNS